MAIPIFEDFLYPFLYQIKDRDLSSKEMKQAIIEHFDLSEEDCAILTKGGKKTQLDDRLNWARQYLRRALFVDLPYHGVYRISQRGLDFIQTHDDLRIKDLMEYPDFAAYANRSTESSNKPKITIPVDPSSKGEIVVTPTEQLESAYQSIHDDLAEDILQKVLEQSPVFFEHLVVDLLVKMGYGGSFANSAKVTQYVHDDGIDGIIYEDKLGLDKIYIQAKKYKPENSIGKPTIQQFSGALDEQKASKGVFITTSSYSKEARSYVAGLNKKIVLIDGKELARYMIEYNVGVSIKAVYEIKCLDNDYFDE